jgi:hypothetical protein
MIAGAFSFPSGFHAAKVRDRTACAQRRIALRPIQNGIGGGLAQIRKVTLRGSVKRDLSRRRTFFTAENKLALLSTRENGSMFSLHAKCAVQKRAFA